MLQPTPVVRVLGHEHTQGGPSAASGKVQPRPSGKASRAARRLEIDRKGSSAPRKSAARPKKRSQVLVEEEVCSCAVSLIHKKIECCLH